MLLRKRISSLFVEHWPAMLVLALAAAAQLFLVSRSIDFLLLNVLPDDAFYYFEIARNIALGLGPTFDGVNATNGYHPLWLLFLTPLYIFSAIFGWGDLVPIYSALGFSIVLNIGTGVLIYKLLGQYTKERWVRTLALVVWTLNPFVLYETINGLETSLSLFLLSAFLFVLIRWQESLSLRRLVLLGFLAGGMILARVDLVFYFIAFLLWIAATQGIRASIRPILTAGLAASVLVVPWLLFNITQFGMLLTSASRGNELVNRTLALASGTGPIAEVKHFIFHLDFHFGNVLVQTGMPLIATLFFGALIALVMMGKITLPRTPREIPAVWVLPTGFLLLFVADAGVRFTGRSWYFISFGIIVALVVALVLRYLPSTRYKGSIISMLALLVLSSFSISWYKELRERMPNQLAMYEVSGWIRENLSPDIRIGAFNAGVTGYFSKRAVFNLDGLVNNRALEAMEARRLWEYIHEQGITHLSEDAAYLTYRYAPFLGIGDPLERLVPVHSIPIAEKGRGDAISVFRIER